MKMIFHQIDRIETETIEDGILSHLLLKFYGDDGKCIGSIQMHSPGHYKKGSLPIIETSEEHKSRILSEAIDHERQEEEDADNALYEEQHNRSLGPGA